MAAANKEPYQQSYYPPVPTGFTKFMRNSVIYQIWRFLVINFKMMKLMRCCPVEHGKKSQ